MTRHTILKLYSQSTISMALLDGWFFECQEPTRTYFMICTEILRGLIRSSCWEYGHRSLLLSAQSSISLDFSTMPISHWSSERRLQAGNYSPGWRNNNFPIHSKLWFQQITRWHSIVSAIQNRPINTANILIQKIRKCRRIDNIVRSQPRSNYLVLSHCLLRKRVQP